MTPLPHHWLCRWRGADGKRGGPKTLGSDSGLEVPHTVASHPGLGSCCFPGCYQLGELGCGTRQVSWLLQSAGGRAYRNQTGKQVLLGACWVQLRRGHPWGTNTWTSVGFLGCPEAVLDSLRD